MTIQTDNQVSIYEEPVVERIRKFIRLESLFTKFYHFREKDLNMENYIALEALCEIYEILTRSDIKSELIREIENQNAVFKKIQDIPDTDSNKLTSVLEKQKLLIDMLHNTKTNYLEFLTNDVLFKTIHKKWILMEKPNDFSKQRSRFSAGGEFYHFTLCVWFLCIPSLNLPETPFSRASSAREKNKKSILLDAQLCVALVMRAERQPSTFDA